MAEDSDLERTEPASARRLQQARDRGQVPRSRELSTFAVLLAGAGGIALMSAPLADGLLNIMRGGLTFGRVEAFDPTMMASRFLLAGIDAALVIGPLFLLLLVAAITAPMLVSGWLFTFESLQADWSRMNPISGLGRVFSWSGVAELVKALLKALLIGGIAAMVLWNEKDALFALAGEPLESAVSHLARISTTTVLWVLGGLALLVLADVPFQIWQHRRGLRMTRDELRQEAKEMEGDPQIKARIRQLQRERARRRMMEQVPKADVVVTNPIHYAVALKYEEGRMAAPKVVAKGAGLVAGRIIEVARDHKVTVLEAPPLARALFRHAELEEEVPVRLYRAVAEVLAWVYQIRHHRGPGDPPAAPTDLPVPPELDPGELPHSSPLTPHSSLHTPH